MSAGMVAAIVVALLIVLILAEMPVGIAIAGSGSLGVVLIEGTESAGNIIGSAAFSATAKYALVVVLMYVLLGTLVANAGVGAGIYRVTNRVVGRLPGGLAATAVAATSVFSGISGSSAADVATFGRVSVAEMAKHGYSKAEAAAVVAAAGAFAVLIPPSIVLIIYGIVAQVSIGALMLAAIVPGILSAFTLMAFVIVRAVLRRRRAGAEVVVGHARTEVAAPVGAAAVPMGPLTEGEEVVDLGPASAPTLRSDLVAVVYTAILFVIVMGGLYTGVFTATEAGAMGAVTALLITLVYRSGTTETRGRIFVRSMREAVDVTSMIFLLLIGGTIFTYFLASSGLAADLADWILDLPVPPLAVLALFLVMLLPLGMFLDGLSILLLTVPLAAPVVMELGFDGIWFGILMLKMIELSLLTPPVGINVFIIAGISRERAEKIFRQVLPFVVLDLAVTAVLFAFPAITLWLPTAAGML